MSLKYMLKNIYSFITGNLMIFILLILSTIVSSVVIFFAYGVYQNYNLVLTYDEGDSDNKYIIMTFQNDEEAYVTKDEFMECVYEIGNISDSLREEISLYTLDGTTDTCDVEYKFLYEDGEVRYPEIFAYNMYENEFILDGRFWTEYEDKNGAKLALVPEGYDAQVGDTIEINGEAYDVIGINTWVNAVLLPVLSVSDTKCTLSLITFESALSTSTYNRVKAIFNSHLGSRVDFVEIETIDKDTYYTYKTVMLVAIFIALIAASNFMILYRYILSTRKRISAIYKILGLTSAKLSIINLGECMTLILPFFLIGMLVYKKYLLPWLAHYFVYIYDAYTNAIYLCLFAIFMVMSIVVIGGMLIFINRKDILTLMKDRG